MKSSPKAWKPNRKSLKKKDLKCIYKIFRKFPRFEKKSVVGLSFLSFAGKAKGCQYNP
jgi:hypothetical protein